MSAEPEVSPARSSRMPHVLQKTLRTRKDNNSSTTSFASTDEGSVSHRPGLKASIDAAVDKVKARANGDNSQSDEKRGSDKLSKLLPRGSRRKRKKQQELEAIGNQEEIRRGRSIGASPTLENEQGGGAFKERSQDSLGNGDDYDDKSGASSLLTYDSDEESQITSPPPLVTHQSHVGYLTLSSPLINKSAVDTTANGVSDSQVTETNDPVLSAAGSTASLPVNIDTAFAPPKHAATLDNPKKISADGRQRAISPVGKLKTTFVPRRATSPKPSPDHESIKSGGAGSSLGGIFGNSRRGSTASRRASTSNEDTSKLPPTVKLPGSPERPQTATTNPPRINTLPATPPNNLANDPSTTVTVTPPTPTGSPDLQSTPSKAPQAPTNTPIQSSTINPNITTSSSGNMISHRRVRSNPAVHSPSKLSNAIAAPLTPTIEEVKTPGSQGSPGGGFFSNFVSAAQNAATTLGNTIANAQGQARSRSGTESSEKLDGNENGEEVTVPAADTYIAGGEGPVKEQKRLAVETLGMGDLNLSHLGISETTQEGDLNGMTTKNDLERPASAHRSEIAAARAEDMSAARAVSAAYSDATPEYRSVSTPTAEDAAPNIGPRSVYEKSLAEDQSPPNGNDADGNNSFRRSGSVRSRISASTKRRHRGSSAATGTTIGAAIGASVLAVAHPGAQGSTPRLTGFAVASKKRNKDFHQFFRSVPEDDYLIEDYSCALQREILLSGRIYISEGHICFSSNILGWVTTLIISFDEIMSVEKKSTAVIFPNAIVIQTLHARNVFASLLAREATYDLIVGIWKISHPSLRSSLNGVRLDGAGGSDRTEKHEASGSEDGFGEDSDEGDEIYDEDEEDEEGLESFTEAGEGSVAGSEVGDAGPGMKSINRKASAIVAAANGAPINGESKGDKAGEAVAAAGVGLDFPGPATHAPTECDDQASHYDKLLQDEIIAAPLGKVYSLMFGPSSGAFMSKWLTDEQKCNDLQLEDDKKGLSEDSRTRTYSYIKPLNGAIGPKQTKCIINETLDSLNLEKAVSVTISTQTPDVPSGNVFSTMTKYCLMWAPGNSTRFIMNCTIEWTGKSWLKGPIEKGANDGQTLFGKEILAALRAAISAKARSGPIASVKGKVKGRRRKDTATTAEKPSNESQVKPAEARSKQKEQDWGLFESLRGLLEPIVDIFKPLLTGNVVIGFVLLALLFTWFRRPSLSAGDGSLGISGLGTPQRIAAYEEIWRREESDLWEWLEDRVGLEGAAFPQGGRIVGDKGMEARLRDEKMSDREMDSAIKVTEQRLEALKGVIERKKTLKSGNAQPQSSGVSAEMEGNPHAASEAGDSASSPCG